MDPAAAAVAAPPQSPPAADIAELIEAAVCPPPAPEATLASPPSPPRGAAAAAAPDGSTPPPPPTSSPPAASPASPLDGAEAWMREAVTELIAEEGVNLTTSPFLEPDQSPHFESMADLAVHYAGCGGRPQRSVCGGLTLAAACSRLKST